MPKDRSIVGYVYVFPYRRDRWEGGYWDERWGDVCEDAECLAKADAEGKQAEEILRAAAGSRSCKYCGEYLDENYEEEGD